MSSAGQPVRRRRTPSGSAQRGPVVAVTGAAGGMYAGLGRRVAERLAGSTAVRRVVALDTVRGAQQGVTWRIVDVRDPVLAARLTGVDVVAHLALDTSPDTPAEERRRHNVNGTSTVLVAAAAAGVRRVVLVTSAMVYGAHADNALPLPDAAPLRARPESSLLGDLLELERLADDAERAHPGLAVTVLRPAVVVGPGADSILGRHFEAPRLLVVKGSRPRWQFCALEDLAAAVELAVLEQVRGRLAVAADGWLEQDDVERISGLRRIELPASVAFGTAERLHRLGLTPAPASDLDYLIHPWAVAADGLRAAGWRPAHSNAECLAAHVTEIGQDHRHAIGARRVGRKDATRAAAGATVAIVGTAALVRRARRRRHG